MRRRNRWLKTLFWGSVLGVFLALVLVFIGGKIFWNQIFGKVNPAISLGVTLAMIAGGIFYSLWKTRQQATPAA